MPVIPYDQGIIQLKHDVRNALDNVHSRLLGDPDSPINFEINFEQLKSWRVYNRV